MWIRSKDKNTLVCCEHIEVDENRIYGGDYQIGEYATEERAVEVLDMIQERIIRGTEFDEIYSGKKTISQFVFQMPQE